MGAGLACPDWPLCNGSAVPNLADPLIAVEYAHRLVAVLTGLFILSTMVLVLLWFRSESNLLTLSVMSFALVIVQSAFGAFTITTELDPLVVTIHLALGTATLAFALMVSLAAVHTTAGAGSVAHATGLSSLNEEVHKADPDETDGGPEKPLRPPFHGGDRKERPRDKDER